LPRRTDTRRGAVDAVARNDRIQLAVSIEVDHHDVARDLAPVLN
jgi:hypothetical protein